MTDSALPMGKEINCHHGNFTLPTEIYGLEIGDNDIKFRCADGVYEATMDNKWKITKLSDEPA